MKMIRRVSELNGCSPQWIALKNSWHTQRWVESSTRLKSAGRESQFPNHPLVLLCFDDQNTSFPTGRMFFPGLQSTDGSVFGISGHNWRKLGGLLYDACGGLFAPGLPVSPIITIWRPEPFAGAPVSNNTHCAPPSTSSLRHQINIPGVTGSAGCVQRSGERILAVVWTSKGGDSSCARRAGELLLSWFWAVSRLSNPDVSQGGDCAAAAPCSQPSWLQHSLWNKPITSVQEFYCFS